MADKSLNYINSGLLVMSSPAIYQIEVQGRIDQKWSDKLAGMNISSTNKADIVVTTLIGKLKDQAALAGLLRTIYELKLPILSVQYKG
jgi:hypothetical protein